MRTIHAGVQGKRVEVSAETVVLALLDIQALE